MPDKWEVGLFPVAPKLPKQGGGLLASYKDCLTVRRRMASWLSAGWCSLREAWTGSWRSSEMEHSAVRTREQSFTTAAKSVSGRCSSLVSQEVGVSDVCHFGRNKREQGREPGSWVGGEMYRDSIRGTILLMPLTLAVRREADPGEDSLGRAACCGFRSLHGTV